MNDPRIEVAPSFLQPRPQWPGHGVDTSVLVVSSDDEVDAALDVDPDLDWASEVAGVWMTALGPTVVMDWQGSGWPLANATMTRILIDELRAAGIKQAVIQPAPDELGSVYGTPPTLPLP